LVIFGIIFLCFCQQSIMPLVYSLCFLAVITPLCIWLHFANERANARMLKDFPHDPFIAERVQTLKYLEQKKYGK
jgi:hypothetical protein